jgi:ABC-type antimicrobial peptide transport system permease subunit
VKIGAVIILDLDVANKLMTEAAEGDKGLNVFCSPDSFEKWGVGERNLTELSIKINNDASIEDADNLWYDTIAQTKGISSYSTTEITESMNKGTRKIMSIYYSMMIIVLLTSAVTVAITLYTDIRMRSSNFAMLRACGMSTRQILFMIWQQNIVYPLIGIACSFVPLMLCNRLFLYIREKVERHEWSPELIPSLLQGGEKSVPWIANVPYYQNLYDFNIKGAVIVMFAVYFAIILLVTLPQIRFIRKQSIADEIEKSSF